MKKRTVLNLGSVSHATMRAEDLIPCFLAECDGLRLSKSERATGWRRNGETFALGDYYQLDSVSAAGVVAGCHRFDWAEVERFAAVLGVELAGGEAEKLNVEG